MMVQLDVYELALGMLWNVRGFEAVWSTNMTECRSCPDGYTSPAGSSALSDCYAGNIR